jgi:hypothetical protein
MPKAGRYDYPSRNLEDSVEYLRKAYEQVKADTMTREVFAQALQMSPKGGGFGLLVGSMGMYSLIETGEGTIRYTDLAKTILHGEPNEIAEGKEKAVRSIALFSDIYDRFGSNFTDDQLRLFLREKAAVDIAEANRLAIEVGKILKRDVQFLGATNAGRKQLEGGGDKTKMDEQTGLTGVMAPGVIGMVQLPGFTVLTFNDEDGAELAIQAINVWKGRLKAKNIEPKVGEE